MKNLRDISQQGIILSQMQTLQLKGGTNDATTSDIIIDVDVDVI